MNKPCVFLLPGLLCDAAIWQHQIDFLGASYDVRVPVFRGFDSFRDMASHTLKDAPERFSVAGHSMGARVALELMDLAGDRVDKLALLNFGAHPVAPSEPARRQQLMDLADKQGLDAVIEQLIPQMFGPEGQRNPELINVFRAMARRSSINDFKGQIHAALNRGDHRPYLQRIDIPVLLVCGSVDAWSPIEQHRDSLALLRRGRLDIIPGSGHMTPMENPRQLNEIFFRWLTDASYSENRG
ncbi:MAG: alpha/beta hydrolase [Pseudomonadota bacterium]